MRRLDSTEGSSQSQGISGCSLRLEERDCLKEDNQYADEIIKGTFEHPADAHVFLTEGAMAEARESAASPITAIHIKVSPRETDTVPKDDSVDCRLGCNNLSGSALRLPRFSGDVSDAVHSEGIGVKVDRVDRGRPSHAVNPKWADDRMQELSLVSTHMTLSERQRTPERGHLREKVSDTCPSAALVKENIASASSRGAFLTEVSVEAARDALVAGTGLGEDDDKDKGGPGQGSQRQAPGREGAEDGDDLIFPEEGHTRTEEGHSRTEGCMTDSRPETPKIEVRLRSTYTPTAHLEQLQLHLTQAQRDELEAVTSGFPSVRLRSACQRSPAKVPCGAQKRPANRCTSHLSSCKRPEVAVGSLRGRSSWGGGEHGYDLLNEVVTGTPLSFWCVIPWIMMEEEEEEEEEECQGGPGGGRGRRGYESAIGGEADGEIVAGKAEM